MKILVLTPVWKRPEITEAYCLGLIRLRKSFDISVLCVLSGEDTTYNHRLMDKYDIEYITYPNKLGAKKNFGLQCALKKDFDYLMEMNSDNIIKDELITIYLGLMDQGVLFIGLGNFAFYNSRTGQAKHRTYTDTLFGIGRCYRKDVLEDASRCVNVEVKETFTTKFDHFKQGSKRAIHPDCLTDKVEVVSEEYHKLWADDAERGMDNHSERRFKARSHEPYIVETDEPLAFDIKSNINIWSYDQMHGEKYPVYKLFQGLSQREKDHLYALYQN